MKWTLLLNIHIFHTHWQITTLMQRLYWLLLVINVKAGSKCNANSVQSKCHDTKEPH